VAHTGYLVFARALAPMVGPAPRTDARESDLDLDATQPIGEEEQG